MNTHLGQLLLSAVLTAIVGVVVMESYQTTPWLADKLIRWSVRLRYVDNPERAKVRGEELIALLKDLPTLFKLPTAGGFALRALAYRLANHRSHPRRQPRTAQRSLGTRFRITLVKAGMVLGCTGTVLWVEFATASVIVSASPESAFMLACALITGGSAASEVVARPSKVSPGLVGGVMYIVTSLMFGTVYFSPWFDFTHALLGGIAYGVACLATYASIRKLKFAGVILGTLINIAGITAVSFAMLDLSLLDLSLLGIESSDVLGFGGLGLTSGAIAVFTVVVARRAQDTVAMGSNSAATSGSGINAIGSAPAMLVDPLSGADIVTSKPSLPISEPRRQDLHRSGELS